ncbi:hypothetical protein KC331_g12537 [Hortaea werneckii]|nr:hypothetical protein KC331_g12537 [Hortaea werneckii]KAI7706861.1 hypothetical protein KC353_g11997 [Hortaea werneckii]
MVDFGYSVGDVVYAIKILYVIIQAFDESKGAKKKYALSSGFLRQLVPVLRRLEDQIPEVSSEERRQELLVNAQTINDAYGVFYDYLRNKYSGLSANEPSKFRQILATMKWSLDELHDKVQKLKSDVTVAMQPYMALMLQDIYVSVGDMAEDFQKASSSSEESSKRIQQITTMLEQIQEQDQILHTATLDYQCGLAEKERMHRSREHVEVQRSLSEIQKTQRSQPTRLDLEAAIQADRETTKSQIEIMLAAHRQLIKSRDELLLTMQKQQALALDEIEAARWERLQAQAEKRAERQATEQKQAQEKIEADVKDATKVATGLADVTGNRAAKRELERFGKIGGILGGIRSMTGRRAGSGSDGSGIGGGGAAGQTTTSTSPSFRPTTRYYGGETGTRFPAAPPSASLEHSVHSPNGSTSPHRTPKPAPPLPTTPPPKRLRDYLSVSSDRNADGAMSGRRNSDSRLHPSTQHPTSDSVVPSTPPGPPSSLTGHRRPSIPGQTSSEPLRPALPPRPQSDISPMMAGNPVNPVTSVAAGATAATKRLSPLSLPPPLPPRNKSPAIIIAESIPSAPKTTRAEAKTSTSSSPRWKIPAPPSPVPRPITPTTLPAAPLQHPPRTPSSSSLSETSQAPSKPSMVSVRKGNTATGEKSSSEVDCRAETTPRFPPPLSPPSPASNPSTPPSSQLPTFAERRRMFEGKGRQGGGGGIPIIAMTSAARKGGGGITADRWIVKTW